VQQQASGFDLGGVEQQVDHPRQPAQLARRDAEHALHGRRVQRALEGGMALQHLQVEQDGGDRRAQFVGGDGQLAVARGQCLLHLGPRFGARFGEHGVHGCQRGGVEQAGVHQARQASELQLFELGGGDGLRERGGRVVAVEAAQMPPDADQQRIACGVRQRAGGAERPGNRLQARVAVGGGGRGGGNGLVVLHGSGAPLHRPAWSSGVRA
jgi:hypothetical protein